MARMDLCSGDHACQVVVPQRRIAATWSADEPATATSKTVTANDLLGAAKVGQSRLGWARDWCAARTCGPLIARSTARLGPRRAWLVERRVRPGVTPPQCGRPIERSLVVNAAPGPAGPEPHRGEVAHPRAVLDCGIARSTSADRCLPSPRRAESASHRQLLEMSRYQAPACASGSSRRRPGNRRKSRSVVTSVAPSSRAIAAIHASLMRLPLASPRRHRSRNSDQ